MLYLNSPPNSICKFIISKIEENSIKIDINRKSKSHMLQYICVE